MERAGSKALAGACVWVWVLLGLTPLVSALSMQAFMFNR